MAQKYTAIGNAKFKDIDAFLEWAKAEGKNWVKEQWSESRCGDGWDETHIGFYNLQGSIAGLTKGLDFYDSPYQIETLKGEVAYMDAFQQMFQVSYSEPRFSVIWDAGNSYVLPTRFLSIKLFENYDDEPVGKLRLLAGDTVSGLVPAGQRDMSVSAAKTALEEKKAEIEKAQKDILAIEAEKQAELEKIKAELEKKYQERTELLRKKQEELEALKIQMEQQLFMLETEIYAIRCYTGETIRFTAIQKGKHAPDTEPIVSYQKIRFLDEELAKWVSVYEFDGDDIRYFEDILRAREDLQDLLCPGPKSVSLVQVSRNSVQYGEHPKIANVLEAYETFHGKQLGILLRDGGNIWMGWTDPERVAISDENVFYQPRSSVELADEHGHPWKNSTKEDVVSRYFIFNFLQGILDRGDMLRIPEKVSIMRPSRYLQFSFADGWLEDNRFGTFADIVERTDQPLQMGDMVLTIRSITRDDIYATRSYSGRSSQYLAWNNNRGRGDKNRTYDARIPGKAILPVNKIDVKEIYEVQYERYVCKVEEEPLKDGVSLLHAIRTDEKAKGCVEKITIENHIFYGESTRGLDDDAMLELFKKWRYNPERNVFCDEEAYHEVPISVKRVSEEKRFFLAAEKESGRWNDKRSTANMEIFPDEYLNLTYLNSVWIQYVIQTGKVGGWRTAGKTTDFANALPYLQIALEYLKVREEDEARLLSQYMDLYPDWQVDLSEWRMEHGYHRLTDARAKRFAKERSHEPHS